MNGQVGKPYWGELCWEGAALKMQSCWHGFYTEQLYTEELYTEELLHREACTQGGLYTQKLLHGETFTRENFYTLLLLLRREVLRRGALTIFYA